MSSAVAYSSDFSYYLLIPPNPEHYLMVIPMAVKLIVVLDPTMVLDIWNYCSRSIFITSKNIPQNSSTFLPYVPFQLSETDAAITSCLFLSSFSVRGEFSCIVYNSSSLDLLSCHECDLALIWKSLFLNPLFTLNMLRTMDFDHHNIL